MYNVFGEIIQHIQTVRLSVPEMSPISDLVKVCKVCWVFWLPKGRDLPYLTPLCFTFSYSSNSNDIAGDSHSLLMAEL